MQKSFAPKLFGFFSEMEFYVKIALSCTILQQGIYWLLRDVELSFISQVFLYWWKL